MRKQKENAYPKKRAISWGGTIDGLEMEKQMCFAVFTPRLTSVAVELSKQIPDRSVGVGSTHFRPEIICQAPKFGCFFRPLNFDLHARLDRLTSRLRSAREIARYCIDHNWPQN
jgi:hypothetical protein